MSWGRVMNLYLLVEGAQYLSQGFMGKKTFKNYFSSWCQGISPDELKDELPERQPRYPFLSALKRFVFFSGQNLFMTK